MNEEIKKDAEEEMNCILELLEGWCLKYDQDYTNAVVLTKNDQITSWGSAKTLTFTEQKSAHKRRQPLGRIDKQPRLLYGKERNL